MKTKKINTLRTVVGITLLATLLLEVSCSSKQDSVENKTSSKVAKNEVKAPEIDIHTAVLTENMTALKQHIAAGTNINEKDPFGGSSPLISASLFGKTEMAKVLIEAGADLNFQNNDGSTALHTAAFFCRPEIVRILLDKGADKTLKNKFGATPYQSVAGPFNDVKNSYDMMGTILGPMGLKLDYAYIEKTRPEIAAMLK
jgi:ankyrin repeat protein